MNSITYILKYYQINYKIYRNGNVGYFLDFCSSAGRHCMMFSLSKFLDSNSGYSLMSGLYKFLLYSLEYRYVIESRCVYNK